MDGREGEGLLSTTWLFLYLGGVLFMAVITTKAVPLGSLYTGP